MIRHFSIPSGILSAERKRTQFATLSQLTGGGSGCTSARSPALPAAAEAAIIRGISRSSDRYRRATFTPFTSWATSLPPSWPRWVAMCRPMCLTIRSKVSFSETPRAIRMAMAFERVQLSPLLSPSFRRRKWASDLLDPPLFTSR